jgi:hypothetical protein
VWNCRVGVLDVLGCGDRDLCGCGFQGDELSHSDAIHQTSTQRLDANFPADRKRWEVHCTSWRTVLGRTKSLTDLLPGSHSHVLRYMGSQYTCYGRPRCRMPY